MEPRCDQCGFALTAGDLTAGVCANCGRPLASGAGADTAVANDSQTRPVPPRASQSTSDTAFDAGAERPTVPPVPPLDAVTAPVMPFAGYQPPVLPRTGPRTPGAVQRPDTVPPTYPRRAGGPYESPENTAALPPALRSDGAAGAPDERSARSRRLVGVSAVALVLVLLLGTGAALLVSNGQLGGLFSLGPTTAIVTNTPGGGPPPPPAGFVRYTAANYTIIYPKGWAETPQTAGTTDLVEFRDPGANAHFEIQTIAGGSDLAGLDDQFIAKLSTALANNLAITPTIANKSTPINASVATETWAMESADVTVPSAAGGQSVTWHVVALATLRNQTTYLIGYFAPQAVFSTQDATVFQPMLSSLRLESPQP